ncbi:AraC family transcriptional regulator [Hahella sp. CR1]|uniref:helix-turn-helix domain-containing protein n=1 Tax=Hahella sp. CR1 TaxID=2992807 RepID=UPI002440F78C|nr:AraC family transcriptional regulator [Hahella sp. CR1]MDG9669267.1 AraC family transcriptional regulator [Hahella sp. CR1]
MDQSLYYHWNNLCLYMGRFDGTYHWQHIADSFIVSLDNEFDVKLANGEVISTRCLMIPANVRCDFILSNQRIAFVSSHFWRNIKTTLTYNYYCCEQDGLLFDFLDACDIARAFRDLYKRRPCANDAKEILDQILNPKQYPLAPPLMDRRVRKLIELLLKNPDLSQSIDDYAELMPISAAHLSRLFKQETNISFSRFRLGVRVMYFIKQFSRSRNLTTAAHDSGFADLAHLNKCHKLLFGICPSQLWLSESELKICVA